MKKPTNKKAYTRQEVMDILLAEYSYWRSSTDERIATFASGAMGAIAAIANVTAAIGFGKTVSQYKQSIAERGRKT